MAHVSAIRSGSHSHRRHPWSRPWSWRAIATVDTASGIGMLAIGLAASGLAGTIALVLGCLVLVESAYLMADPRGQKRRPEQSDYRPR
jgi:hypothetical protein